ncbi:sporulation integral membrane protein YlbJ [Thermoactinomyces mirandus]|uniref:Sporulation integral membrane protein YlbJ n=1 Tax=Thermoactinomyces mirandus TaxID=2756294 RepID=A0A7W1XSE4_9BACL|nr:sporulation integral membrane protein YlbJ [Thermoactinomyces mirandus]MBA4602414.1 sporulation integral membrane protein YlbJ [Thermoactinomyces mirandus]
MIPSLLRSQMKTIFLASITFFIAVILVLYPEQAVKSSLRGLHIWWDVVFPALLPFFITAEMMMGFGVVHFLGVLLEPLMRPLFRVPGAGAFVMSVGLISGNPMGAKLTARLREQKLISREEGERLICFTSTAGPLFIFGAVAVGFFENKSIGLILAVAHYVSTIIVGFVMRFYESQAPPTPPPAKRKGFILSRAISAMHRARLQDGRTLGQLIGQSVTSAIQTLLLIGGFVMMFSVLTHLINYVGVTGPFIRAIAQMLVFFSFPAELSESILVGLFEITVGSQVASTTDPSIPLLFKLAIVSLIIGWNGLSIHAQVASMISRSDIRYYPYFAAKILHGFLAAFITVLIYPLFEPYLQQTPAIISVFRPYSAWFLSLWDILQGFAIAVSLIWFVALIYQEFKELTNSYRYNKTR